MSIIYYNRAGGAVLGALNQRDVKYEQQLFRAGIDYDTLETAEQITAAQIAGAAVRGGKLEVSS